MIDLGPNAVFIVWSYVGVAVATLALIGWTVYDRARVEKRIAALESQGVRRRSQDVA